MSPTPSAPTERQVEAEAGLAATSGQTLSALPVPKPRLETGHHIAPIVPRDLEEAFRYAQVICKAGLAPDSYNGPGKIPDPQKVVVGIMKGLEVGIAPINALSVIAIINGRPCIWGDGAMALIQKAGQLINTETIWEGNLEDETLKCTFKAWRKGQPNPFVGEFSIEDAKRANLWNNPRRPVWHQYPKRMLFSRARAFPLRDGFADALMGLGIREEAEDLPPAVEEKPDTSFLDDGVERMSPAEAAEIDLLEGPNAGTEEEQADHEADATEAAGERRAEETPPTQAEHDAMDAALEETPSKKLAARVMGKASFDGEPTDVTNAG
jgi:hypothetical protein